MAHCVLWSLYNSSKSAQRGRSCSLPHKPAPCNLQRGRRNRTVFCYHKELKQLLGSLLSTIQPEILCAPMQWMLQYGGILPISLQITSMTQTSTLKSKYTSVCGKSQHIPPSLKRSLRTTLRIFIRIPLSDDF